MSFYSWREAASVLKEATNPVTPEQLELAQWAGVDVETDTPRIVAAARLRTALAKELYLVAEKRVSDRTKSYLGNLQKTMGFINNPANEEEGIAWINHLRLVQRLKSLEDQKPSRGDVVRTANDEPAVISSIGEDGRVYFKGGLGFGNWPDQIVVVVRAGDTSETAERARQYAENLAAQRSAPSAWSIAKRQELSKFMITTKLLECDIDELQRTIDGADDERPIQSFLEQHTHILGALVSGHECYCIPQKRLGAEYVTDFIIGSVDSLGIQWLLLELETPRSSIYLKDGRQLGAKARQGVNQIIQWRDWLTENLAYARKRRSEDGLGLFDIRPKSEGVVLVGRRSLMTTTGESARHDLRESSRVFVHSYDWLIEALRYSLKYTGIPAANPYLFVHENNNMIDVSR